MHFLLYKGSCPLHVHVVVGAVHTRHAAGELIRLHVEGGGDAGGAGQPCMLRVEGLPAGRWWLGRRFQGEPLISLGLHAYCHSTQAEMHTCMHVL